MSISSIQGRDRMSGCQDDLIELLTCEIGEKTKCVPADQSCWRQEGRDVEGASLISVPLLTYRIRMARGKIKIKQSRSESFDDLVNSPINSLFFAFV